MHFARPACTHMTRRTTIEIDEALLDRAMDALGCTTMRSTVEEALHRGADTATDQSERLAAARNGYLDRLAIRAELGVLASDEMWR